MEMQQNSKAIKTFLSLTGGSILYCLSAASIVYGIGQIIGPTLGKSILLSQTLPCLLALNIYELAILGVLVAIVLLRNVTDDAISLLVLMALFLVTSGLTLGTLTPGDPEKCLYIGLGCAGLAMGKLFVLRRYLNVPISITSFIGFACILFWTFLAAPVMGKPFVTGYWPDEIRRDQWLLWWLLLLLGTVLILLDAVISTPNRRSEGAAFIRTRAMVLIFAIVLLSAAIVYQYAITYMYVIDSVWGDYLPVCVLISLLGIELMRSLSNKHEHLRVVISAIPLALVLWAILDKQVASNEVLSIQVLWYPPVLLGLTGITMTALAIRHRWQNFFYVGIAYALGVLLTFGYTPEKPFDLNWELAAGGTVAILLILGVVKQNILLCFGAVVLLAGGLGMTDGLARFARIHNLTIPGAVTGIAGIGTLVVCALFGTKVHKWIIIFGSICLMFGLFDYLPKPLAWKDLGIAAAIALMCLVLWFRTRYLFALPLLWLPFVPKVYVFWSTMSSWGFIVLSFILLFLGGTVSYFFKQNKVIHETASERPVLTQDS